MPQRLTHSTARCACDRALFSLLIMLASAANAQAQQAIRGRVTTDSGAAIRAADVIVTIAPTTEVISGLTDSSGSYRIVIPNPTGEYLVYIGALGKKPFRQRVTIAKGDSIAIVNAKLASNVQALATVNVQARKARPQRSLASDGGFGTDATDKSVDGVLAAIPPDQLGNLDAMASMIPGLSIMPGGVSAFGLGPDANSATLNGLAFGGSDFPRDAVTNTRFRSSPWDPTIGGFSGVQTAVSLSSGGNIIRRRGHATIDAPSLQFSDPVASRLGQKFTNVSLDEGGTGAFKLDKWYYNFGAHVARNSSSIASLSDLDPDALGRASISADSAARLVQLLAAAGIPIGASGIPTARTTNTFSLLERIDRAPAPTVGTAAPGPVMAATLFAKYSQAEAQSLGPTVAPSFAGKSTSGLFGVQGIYSRYFGKDGDYVSETTSGVSVNTNSGTPYINLPGGSVLIASDAGLGALSFGGNSALTSDAHSWTWETINQTNLLFKGRSSMPVKIYLQSRFDGFDQSLAANRLGRFGFNSLADLAANTPSSFSRTWNAPDRSGGEWIGAAAFGGNWIATNVTLTGGFRVDANAFTSAPQSNPEVARAFGVSTDHAPNGIDISPRLGVVWKYTGGGGLSVSTNGYAVMAKSFSQLRGGVGKFRSNLSSTLLADAISNTGLPGSTQQLLCVGAAVPAADWRSFESNASSIPTSCAGGAANFADTARAVTLFDRSYRPAESWRGNLGWTTSNVLNTYLSVDATYSLNLHQPGTVDLNFSGSPQFTLPDEANRPVFVDIANVVPATGALSSSGSRISPAFGRVSNRVSDLTSRTSQLAVYAIPSLPGNFVWTIIGYTYTHSRAEARGFDGSSAVDPRTVEWARSSFAPTHQVTLQLSRLLKGGTISLNAAIRTSSGFAYTPMIGGDISGDGSANDRAFVFNPALVSDATLASGLRSLMTSGSSSARDCLASQVGRIADRNSCVGPWFTTANGSVVFADIPRTNNRMRITLAMTNIAGGVDQLLHGSSSLRGWGSPPLPDQTLYRVKGFDASAKRFIYDVNPRFGATDPAFTTRRNPFRLALDVQVDLGPSVSEQQVEQNIRIRPSLYGTRASADTIKARYVRSTFTNLYTVILRNADSLALSREQVDRIKAQEAVLKVRADSVYSPLASYLVALGDGFDVKEAAKRVKETGDAMWELIYAEKPFLKEVLNPAQILLLPGSIRDMVTVPNYKGRFFFGF